MTEPLRIAQDRTLVVSPGHGVRTAWVDVFNVRLACRDRMAIGDVDAAYRKRLQLGDAQPWPPPVGRWDGDRFVIHDGRHEFLATVMLGCAKILVAWVEEIDHLGKGKRE